MRRMYSENQLENQTEELLASGNLPSVKADEIIENMEGYSFNYSSTTGYTIENVYAGAVKNGNKLTLVLAFNITRTQDDLSGNVKIGEFTIPSEVGERLYETQVGAYNYLSNQILSFWSQAWFKQDINCYLSKTSTTKLSLNVLGEVATNLTKNTKYYARFESTFLLSENLAN